MQPVPRLHWSTLGEPTQGLEGLWSMQWEITLDKGPIPALPPPDTDLWVLTVQCDEPPPILGRLIAEVGALPILLLRPEKAGPLSSVQLLAWSRLGSLRWGLLGPDVPQPGLRPLALASQSLSASQALSYGMVGIGPAMKSVLDKAQAAAATRATVMLLGESGTGKEVVAKAIHRMSREAEAPFVPVHCGAIPENLLESELFGYQKGAFTDARKDQPGKFREAHGGTIFLDEIATMPLQAQIRLLRVLQEREVQPLGGGGPVKVDVRVIVASNKDLWEKVKEGNFREDLYYRLDVVPITLPPLRARREEIPFLVQHFLIRKGREHGLYPKALHPSVEAFLQSFSWPGNVRQLENAVERAVVLSGTRPVLIREDFAFLLEARYQMDPIPQESWPVLEQPLVLMAPETPASSLSLELPATGMDLNQVVSDVEKKLMLQSLAITRGNKKRAAELLGLKRTTFLEKMKRLDLEDTFEDSQDPDAAP